MTQETEACPYDICDGTGWYDEWFNDELITTECVCSLEIRAENSIKD